MNAAPLWGVKYPAILRKRGSPMKKTLAYVFAGALMFGATACGPSEEDNNANNNTTTPVNNTTTPVNNTTTPVNNTTTTTPPGNMTTPPANNTNATTPPGNMTTPPDGARAKLQVYYDTSSKLLCKAVYQCPTGDAFFSIALGRFADEAACAQGVYAELGDVDIERQVEALESGRLVFDDANAATCKAELDALLASPDPCSIYELFDTESEACEQSFKGTVIEGGSCLDDDECGDGFYCEQGIDTPECYGSCEPLSNDKVCGEQLCGASEYCDFATEACVPTKATGADCNDDEECGDEDSLSYCDYTQLSSSGEDGGVCADYFTKDKGEDCYFEEECKDGLECSDEEGVCDDPVTITVNDTGGACLLSGSGPICKPGLTCQNYSSFEGGPQGTCGPPVAKGGDCFFDFDCVIGAICTGADGNTMTPGTCGDKLADGATCTDSEQCASGDCNYEGIGGDGVCEAANSCVLPE